MSKKSKKEHQTKPIVRRMIFSIALALIFGLLCSYFAWKSDPILSLNYYYWGWPIMLNIIWTIISIDMIFWPFIMWYEKAVFVAWMTLFAWAFYGMIIDYVVTKYSAEWEDLLKWIK